MQKTRVLYITQEIDPFLISTELSNLVRQVAQGTMEAEKEIRVFMPRFGVVNERRHQLHEVIRLSGMNMIVNDLDYPLIIKVASIQQAKMQVYFIDNEEYFKRKFVFHDEDDKFYADNDERAIFFSRGVIETVKKLGWKPDIVHCNGWMSSLVPLYLKNTYKDEPHFADAKIVYSVYNDKNEKLDAKIGDKIQFDGIDASQLDALTTTDINGLHQLGMTHADAVVCGTDTINSEVESYKASMDKPMLDVDHDENIVDQFQEFYNNLIENGVLAE